MATVWLWSDVMGVGIWGYYDVWPTEVDEEIGSDWVPGGPGLGFGFSECDDFGDLKGIWGLWLRLGDLGIGFAKQGFRFWGFRDFCLESETG